MVAGPMFGFTGTGVGPGLGELVESFEREICWGKWEQLRTTSIQIDAATVDPTSSPTTLIRPGLILGLIAATGKAKQYDPAAVDGSDIARAILTQPFTMVNLLGTTQELYVNVLIGGPVKASMLYGLDLQARKQLAGNFIFDDVPSNSAFGEWLQIKAKTADYTLTSADDRTMLTTQGASGAVIFTLPAPAIGLKQMRVLFYNEVNQDMTVTCASASKLVVFNNAAATSVALSTSGQKIGGAFEATINADGTKWIIMPRVSGHTITVA